MSLFWKAEQETVQVQCGKERGCLVTGHSPHPLLPKATWVSCCLCRVSEQALRLPASILVGVFFREVIDCWTWNDCAFGVSYQPIKPAKQNQDLLRGGNGKDVFCQMLLLEMDSLDILAFTFLSEVAEPAAVYCPG